MSDVPSNGRSRGDQAYRWLIGLGIAAIGGLAWNIQGDINKTVDDIRKTADAVQALQVQVADIRAKLDWAGRQNETQDNAIGELQRRVWRLPPGPP